MSAPEAVACRECHRTDHHQLSCSHVRYEGRVVIAPGDEVAAPHESEQPYCPGPDVGCYFDSAVGHGWPDGVCVHTGGTCYYGDEA